MHVSSSRQSDIPISVPPVAALSAHSSIVAKLDISQLTALRSCLPAAIGPPDMPFQCTIVQLCLHYIL